MKSSIALRQTHSNCQVVNLPANGVPPTAAFLQNSGLPSNIFSATNTSAGAARYYWTFGDFTGSNAVDAYHAYATGGSYPVNLRAAATNGMMDMTAGKQLVSVEPMGSVPEIALLGASPNPTAGATRIGVRLNQGAVAEVSLFGLDGRRVRTLSSGYRPSGE